MIGIVSISAGKRVKSADEFTTAGGKGNVALVVGISLSTLIGGATTVGTAQTAFSYGLAGWWYTLGSTAGFLIMGFVLARPIRNSGHQTMTSMIRDEFGKTAELVASCVLFLGMVISLSSQIVSSCAVLQSMFPSIDSLANLSCCFFLSLFCALWGGSVSSGYAGKYKAFLITLITLCGGLLILSRTDLQTLSSVLDAKVYFNLFSRGAGYELSNGLATALGICCSQANVQAVLSARDEVTAKKGMAICSIVMPVIGIGSVLIGMYMRMTNSEMNASLAFSTFLLDNFPEYLGGIGVGTLFISLILSAAGTALGCSSIFTKDILEPLFHCANSSEKELLYLRRSFFGTLCTATFLGSGLFGNSILSFAFLSMSIRCSSVVVPFLFTVFFKNQADRRWVIASEIIGPVAACIAGLSDRVKIAPFYAGTGTALLLCLVGMAVKKRASHEQAEIS